MSRPNFIAFIATTLFLCSLICLVGVWSRRAAFDGLLAQNAALRQQLQQAQADRQAALDKTAGNELEMQNLRQDSMALAVLREQLKTNAPSLDAPPGFYADSNRLVYLNYTTPDPVLRSFLRWVMGGKEDSESKGRAIFQKICATCHQQQGEGKDGLAPPLAGSEWIKAPGGERLVRMLLNGVSGPIQVQGKTWNLVMPPWRENLDDEQIATVLNYVRSQWGGEGVAPIKPELAAAARQESHPKPETMEELLRIKVEKEP
jgi:mono/diheme cytochrome c family protein